MPLRKTPPAVFRFVLALLAVLSAPVAVAAQFPDERATALEHARALQAEVSEMSMRLWDYSEIALRETRSAAYLTDLLESEGFTVERGVADMPTAFVASWGTGSPTVGILAEYDALPGIGNAPRPERTPREDGHRHGQGCGHTLFGAGSVAGAIAVKRTMEDEGVRGTIKLFGTPAEETVVGKVYMARDGVFDGVDMMLEWHPGLETEVGNTVSKAMNNFRVRFRGQAAHSSADPWNGRSALDAVELMNDAVNLMREHVRPTTRIHYVISDGGMAPNVVPETAEVWYYVRDSDRELVDGWYDWLLKIAEGAAMATRTTHEVYLTTGVHEYLLNRPLQEALQANMEALGDPEYPEEFHEFARQLQAFLEIEETGLTTEVHPLPAEPEIGMGGSTDVAEASHMMPTAGFSVTSAAAGIPWHSWATSASHGTQGSVVAAQRAAEILAVTSVQLLTDSKLRERAQSFFDGAKGGEPYVSPIPADQEPPVPTETGGN